MPRRPAASAAAAPIAFSQAEALAGGLGQPLHAFAHRRIGEGEDVVGHAGGFRHVRERGELGQGRERRSKAGQQGPPKVGIRVGDEGVVLVRPHVFGFDVLPGGLVGETPAGPVDELQTEQFEDLGGSDRSGLEVGPEVLVVFDERSGRLLVVVHRLLLGEPAVLPHVEAHRGRDRHARGLLQGDGVDEQLDALLVVLAGGVARRTRPPARSASARSAAPGAPSSRVGPSLRTSGHQPSSLTNARRAPGPNCRSC